MFKLFKDKDKFKCSKCKKILKKTDLKMIKGTKKYCCKKCCPHKKGSEKVSKSKNVCEFC